MKSPDRQNKLWAGHRMILPPVRKLAASRCGQCRFMVEIQGREETRLGCVVHVPGYANLRKRVPGKLQLAELLKQVGLEMLEDILQRGDPHSQVCSKFKPTF